jgi:hypothetical protein
LYYINVEKHTSDFEERVLPLQWAVDQVILIAGSFQWRGIDKSDDYRRSSSFTGVYRFPLPWNCHSHNKRTKNWRNRYYSVSNHQVDCHIPSNDSTGYIRGLRTLLVLALSVKHLIKLRVTSYSKFRQVYRLYRHRLPTSRRMYRGKSRSPDCSHEGHGAVRLCQDHVRFLPPFSCDLAHSRWLLDPGSSVSR